MTSQTLSRRVRSPEDIRVGDYIAVTHTHYQCMPDNLDVAMCGSALEPISITALPEDAGTPLKVLAVCLPFIIGRTTRGGREVIDTRRHVLTRVSKAYAKAAKPKAANPTSTRGQCKGKGKKSKKR